MISFTLLLSLREKCTNSLFLSVFSCIRTEYGDLRGTSVFSPITGKYRSEKNAIFGHFSRCGLKFYSQMIKITLLITNSEHFKAYQIMRYPNFQILLLTSMLKNTNRQKNMIVN